MHIFDRISDLVFPPCCVGCGSLTGWLCVACELQWRKLLRTTVQVYPLKQLPIFVAARDPLGLVSKLLFAWKYQRYYQAGATLQSLWVDAFVRTFFTTQHTILVPIPIHWFKNWQRGFNQAELLARAAKDVWCVPYYLLLKRQRYTVTQVGLSKLERQNNVHSAFVLDERLASQVKRENLVILVDDIVTSGTTLLECSQVLHQAGFHHIVALVLQRGTR